jgi:hypothetical protein
VGGTTKRMLRNRGARRHWDDARARFVRTGAICARSAHNIRRCSPPALAPRLRSVLRRHLRGHRGLPRGAHRRHAAQAALHCRARRAGAVQGPRHRCVLAGGGRRRVGGAGTQISTRALQSVWLAQTQPPSPHLPPSPLAVQAARCCSRCAWSHRT